MSETMIQKKTILLVLSAVTILVLCYTFNIMAPPNIIAYSPPPLKMPEQNSKMNRLVRLDDISSLSLERYKLPRTSIFTDILKEKEALNFPPCKDAKLATNPTLSKMHITGKTKTMNINNTIAVLITLYDGYGSPKSVGGDIVIARLTNSKSHSAVSGHVEDHGNGTYTATFELLFRGDSFINVDVLWTREAVTSLYRIRNQVPYCLRSTSAVFKNGSRQETTICHPFYQNIQNSTSGLCNFTQMNSGMSWFCGRPRDTRLQCSHWISVKTSEPRAPYTTDEYILVSRNVDQIRIPGSIKIYVEDKSDVTDIIRPNYRIPCFKYSPANLWYTHTTRNGFLYKNRWYQKHCEAVQNSLKCVTNKTLLIFGDSTVRQWYKDIEKRFRCVLQTKKWTKEKWNEYTVCKNKNINFTTQFIPHSHPLSNNVKVMSIKTRLNQIGQNEDVIAVIHMYLHLTPCHYSVFKSRMGEIMISVEKLLSRNKLAKVIIKGPHLHNELPHVLASYNAYIYRRIIFELFEGLHDKVYYVDYIDISNALHITKRHPSDEQVSMMVDMALNYVCY